MNTMYNLTRHEIEGLYKKTFLNMNSFWFKLDRHKLLKKLYKDRHINFFNNLYYCWSGHKCKMVSQTRYKNERDFKCYECNKKGKYQDGAYVCA